MSSYTEDYHWISNLHPDVQLELFRRLTVYLSSRDLAQVMKLIENGSSVYEAHRRSGLIARYYIQLLRILDDVEDKRSE